MPANEVEIDILFRAGGSRETPEVPDIRSERGTRSDSELIPMADVDIAVARIDSGDVRFRRVIASHDEEMADAA
ncbi:MAG: hypothetical protein INR65_16115 [Gluconacetobacter diazotrophicus]|nr:hypothetical protein [Gluconacetobacter diazotrophicus]